MGKLILCIDDNIQYLRLIRKMLEQMGHRVLEAPDGYVGINLALEHSPDLVFSDINMPMIDGEEIVERFRNTPQLKEIPVIAVTANVRRGDRERFIASGFNDYLPKPVTRKELVEKIEEFFGPARAG